MAHLWSCWCGKYYRCDIDHPPRTRLCCFDEEQHEHNCPDQLLHGPRKVEIAFVKISSENFTGAEMQIYAQSSDWLKEAILSQPMKRD